MHEHGSKAGVASDANEYQQAALRTEADQAAVLDRLHKAGPKLMRLLDGAVGLSADAGEVLGLVQKAVEYGRPVDPVKLK
jgi:NTP pyrophosphatase (non-canonical NTP hydrolase)